jgi:hypothetical protein
LYGKLLLLPARQVAATPPQHALEHRKQREYFVRHRALAARQRRKAGFEILGNGQ